MLAHMLASWDRLMVSSALCNSVCPGVGHDDDSDSLSSPALQYIFRSVEVSKSTRVEDL